MTGDPYCPKHGFLRCDCWDIPIWPQPYYQHNFLIDNSLNSTLSTLNLLENPNMKLEDYLEDRKKKLEDQLKNYEDAKNELEKVNAALLALKSLQPLK